MAPTADGRSHAEPHHRTTVFVLACTVSLMTVLDVSVVVVALPDLGIDLGLSPVQLQWVVNSYALTFAGFLLLGGRAADLLGHRRVFLFGVVAFTTASLAGGLAQNDWQIIGARGVQGFGAAILAPIALTLLTSTYRDPRELARALGVWTGVIGLGGALGGVVGGVLTGLLSWRWVLIINVPVGVCLALGALWALPAASASARRERLDVPGSVTITLGTGALVAGIVNGQETGWATPLSWALLVAAASLVAMFVSIERRSRSPLVPLSVFRVRPVAVANTISFWTGGMVFVTFYFLSLYLQDVRDTDPLETGVALLPPAIGIAAGAYLAPPLLARAGGRRVFVTGALASTVGFAWLATLTPHSNYLAHVVVPATLVMVGAGLSGLPLTLAATRHVGAEQAGLASGLLNASRQIGGAILLAALVALAAAVTDMSGPDSPLGDALTSGYRAAFVAAAALMLAAGAAGAALPRTDAPPGARLAAAPELAEP